MTESAYGPISLIALLNIRYGSSAAHHGVESQGPGLKITFRPIADVPSITENGYKLMCKKLFAGVIALITLTAAATGIAGEDELHREIREFHIAFVADGSVGRWRDAGKEGAINYLIYSGGHEEVYKILFIQWSQDAPTQPNNQSLTVTRAINLIHGVFAVPTLVSKSPYTLHVVVDTIYCGEPQSYNVEILNKGKYKIDYLNKERCEDADTSGVYAN